MELGNRFWGKVKQASKLTTEQVREMRQIRKDTGMTYRKLGVMYGVSRQQAWNICTSKSWNDT